MFFLYTTKTLLKAKKKKTIEKNNGISPDLPTVLMVFPGLLKRTS